MDLHGYLAVYPTLNGLQINPCTPHGFGDFKITREYRNAVYHITVKNPSDVCKGVAKMVVDGTEVAGNVIPYDAGKTEVNVEVTMG